MKVNQLFLLFSCQVVSDSLQPQGLKHTRLPCPSLSPRVCSNSCPLSQWCLPNISYSVALFSACPQSFPSSGAFPMSRLFESAPYIYIYISPPSQVHLLHPNTLGHHRATSRAPCAIQQSNYTPIKTFKKLKLKKQNFMFLRKFC